MFHVISFCIRFSCLFSWSWWCNRDRHLPSWHNNTMTDTYDDSLLEPTRPLFKNLLKKFQELGEDTSGSEMGASSDPLRNLFQRLIRGNTPPHPSRKARLLFNTSRDSLLNACILLAKYPVTAQVCAKHWSYKLFLIISNLLLSLCLALVGIFLSDNECQWSTSRRMEIWGRYFGSSFDCKSASTPTVNSSLLIGDQHRWQYVGWRILHWSGAHQALRGCRQVYYLAGWLFLSLVM